MKSPLTRSIPFWILLVASVGLAAAGAILISQHLGTMTKTLGDGSATGLEVYGGQSWIVVGAALVGAGALGVLLTLALAAASALIPTTAGAAAAAPATAVADGAAVLGLSDPEGALDAPATAQEIAPDGAEAAQADSEAAQDDAAEPADAVSAR
ncbi:hypothetical protein [Microbacterium sp. 22242]|uniref:hypothetical protein n=1 Tax=Microbacterium sp. 22242 TaxID=3453896 RepID=UPI003F864A62